MIHDREYHAYLVHNGDRNASGDALGGHFPLLDCRAQAADPAAAECTPSSWIALPADFYKGDRSMRESGFDVSFRFGPFGAATHHFAAVCLNSLLYKTEKDLERISTTLGRTDEAKQWSAKAEERRKRMTQYFWNAERGLFFDYNTVTAKRSAYEYATAFYPLWAGLASKQEAAAAAQNLDLFEQPGGIAMSRNESGAQWDFPYGWAPVELLAVEGLRRYGFNAEADRISRKFASMVLENFRRDHTIREKYNVVTRSSETAVVEGYAQNVTGFGWTNAVFLEFLHQTPDALDSAGGAPEEAQTPGKKTPGTKIVKKIAK
jgi:alpha,alpha-trehalase